ncbi:CTP-dependent riboflavin kinase [Natrinema soli]|uniref:Riboflavin kinase n=1 Tax=Natrinema soli TaxID=1930624 RepID=A0ABD5SNK2_9EURY|nr:CTP-dependent riboflavin kinase [Natrinema soli]
MTVTVDGTVTSGFGRGKEFVSLEGYSRQFQGVLGYEPYPGTLNLDLSRSVDGQFERLEARRIDGWQDGDRSFGIVYCYPATIVDADESVRLHAIVPKRTDHDTSTLELISPVALRERFELSDGASISIRIESAPSETETVDSGSLSN